jgi:hypothetical protein
VFVALMLFGIMALAGLVIDLGFARLAQRQMQVAVDAAALEGLRFRDAVPDAWLNDPDILDEIEAVCGPRPSTPQDPNNPNWQDWYDCARRWAASRNVAFVFDNDLDLTNGDLGAFNTGVGQFGAGPVVELSGGIGDPAFNAGQLITIPATQVYKPRRSDGSFGLELNEGDAVHGDMLAGRYTEQDPVNPNNPDWHDEQPDYNRADFNPSATPRDAFLVRMRRIHDDIDVDGIDSVDGVSSKGPEIPFLFARGSLMATGDPTAGYSPRHHGITVRATAIAQARLAMSVGLPQTAQGMQGSLGMAIELGTWRSATGPIPSANCFLSAARVVGDSVSPTNSAVTSQTGFVGLFLDTPQIDRRVVAFGFGSVDNLGNVTVDTSRLVAAENVSGVFANGFDTSAPISAILEQIRVQGLQDEAGIVHASVSVR